MSRLSTPPRTSPAAPIAPPVHAGSFVVYGDVHKPATLTVSDLREGWQQHRAEVVFDCTTNGPQHHTFEGSLLREVVAQAGPAFDPRRRKERSRFVLSVSGGDSHHTVLSWAEIDTDFRDTPILLATRMDGQPLDTAGSQLVVPSDRCGARYISAITSIWLGACRLPEGADDRRLARALSRSLLAPARLASRAVGPRSPGRPKP